MAQPTFQDRTYQERQGGDFWDHSEQIFEETWAGPWERYGLGPRSNNMATWKFDPFISHTPDYRAALYEDTQPFMVEVQGTGLGGAKNGVLTHKFKQKKLDNLAKWNSVGEVTFWLWEDSSKTWLWTSYVSIRGMIARGFATEGNFDGTRRYWEIPVETVAELGDTERLYDKYGR